MSGCPINTQESPKLSPVSIKLGTWPQDFCCVNIWREKIETYCLLRWLILNCYYNSENLWKIPSQVQVKIAQHNWLRNNSCQTGLMSGNWNWIMSFQKRFLKEARSQIGWSSGFHGRKDSCSQYWTFSAHLYTTRQQRALWFFLTGTQRIQRKRLSPSMISLKANSWHMIIFLGNPLIRHFLWFSHSL